MKDIIRTITSLLSSHTSENPLILKQPFPIACENDTPEDVKENPTIEAACIYEGKITVKVNTPGAIEDDMCVMWVSIEQFLDEYKASIYAGIMMEFTRQALAEFFELDSPSSDCTMKSFEMKEYGFEVVSVSVIDGSEHLRKVSLEDLKAFINRFD